VVPVEWSLAWPAFSQEWAGLATVACAGVYHGVFQGFGWLEKV
jgi:hypothetical protein